MLHSNEIVALIHCFQNETHLLKRVSHKLVSNNHLNLLENSTVRFLIPIHH